MDSGTITRRPICGSKIIKSKFKKEKKRRGCRGGVRLTKFKVKQKMLNSMISNSPCLYTLSQKWKKGVYVYLDNVFLPEDIENKMLEMINSNNMKKQNGVKHSNGVVGTRTLTGSYNLGVVRQVGIWDQS